MPLGAILRKHDIGYHIYADDTQLYISFKSKKPLGSLEKLNSCISDIRVWMIKHKLKINDAKTEFIIFRSPLLRTDLSSVSISVPDKYYHRAKPVIWVWFLVVFSFFEKTTYYCRARRLSVRPSVCLSVCPSVCGNNFFSR